MSNETMNVRVEVWPVAADAAGVWLLDVDAWRSPNVPADDEPHSEVERFLAASGMTPQVVHSTSWRVDGPAVFVTYLVVVDIGDDLVLDEWPDAQPVAAALAAEVGRPWQHAATDPPVPRYIDALLHALRHLRFLLDNDSAVAAALDGHWRRHLEPLEPALAAMYKAA